VNSVLGSDVRIGDPGFPALRDAVESSITALIAQSSDGWTPALTSARAELMRRAWRVIEDRHIDPEFSIAQLSDTLQVSATHLHRVFAAASVTPLQALQERRARRAAALLNHGRVTSGEELARVASQSGFPSVAVMRRALNRDGH
jgi:AraC-like DNA-binding protein